MAETDKVERRPTAAALRKQAMRLIGERKEIVKRIRAQDEDGRAIMGEIHQVIQGAGKHSPLAGENIVCIENYKSAARVFQKNPQELSDQFSVLDKFDEAIRKDQALQAELGAKDKELDALAGEMRVVFVAKWRGVYTPLCDRIAKLLAPHMNDWEEARGLAARTDHLEYIYHLRRTAADCDGPVGSILNLLSAFEALGRVDSVWSSAAEIPK